MRTAIATVCLSGTLPEKLEAIAAAQFKGVEIFENDLLSFNGTPADVRRMAGDLGLEIITFQPFRDFEGMPEPQRAKVFARAERKFDVMEELGCDLLLVCSNVSPDALGGVDRAAADFRELGERAAKRGLRVGYEALAWGRHVNDYRDAWEVVRRARSPGDRARARFLPHPRAQDRSHADARDPEGPDLPRPDRRRAAPGDGLPLLEPSLPLLPGPGRAAGRRLHGGAAGDRLSTGSSRSRSSATGSAPARRAASRSTASAP